MKFSIHNNIRFLRKQHGWTQTDLASRMGISRSMIAAYEEYRSIPLLLQTMKLADVFSIDLDSLARRDLEKEVVGNH